MRRRQVLGALAAVAAVATRPLRAQTRSRTVAFLSGRAPEADAAFLDAFRRGLADSGFVIGRDVDIDYRTANGDPGRLSALAADLVRQDVALIFASSTVSAIAAKAATPTIPIVFTGASDPVAIGLVATLNRPGGNLTGATMYAHTFGAKRLELLRELVPDRSVVAILLNPVNPSAAAEQRDLRAAAEKLGISTMMLEARTAAEIDVAFATLASRGLHALYLLDDPLFTGQVRQMTALSARHGVVMISTLREFPKAGGIVSYGTDFTEVHRQCGVYAGRILGGARPGELPVVLPTKFELVLNLRAARAIGLAIPPSLLVRADEVIE